MGKRPKNSPARIPTIDDFKLTEQQRKFHDAYIEGPTRGNASASAVAAGYEERTAQRDSYKWVPAPGTTRESAGSLRSAVAKAIYWSLDAQRMIRDEVTARKTEREIEKQVVSKQYVVETLMDLAERCMGKDLSKNRKIALELLEEVADRVDTATRSVIADLFVKHANKHRVFHPAGAKEAVKLLGLEIGMFTRVAKAPPETPVDQMTAQQLFDEEKKLVERYAQLTSEAKKKGNGKDKH